MKKSSRLLLSLLMAVAFVFLPATANAAPPNQQASQAMDNKIVKKIDKEKIYEHVHELSVNIGPRVAGTEGERQAVDYIVSQYESYGLDVEIQPFEFQRRIDGELVTFTSHNVIATKAPHKNHATGEILYLGSHHDSVPGVPGASDNASGVGVNLEIARVISNMPTTTEIRFLTFGAEEFGLLGSRHYVSTLTEDEKSRSVGMFNFDMVGSKNAGEMIMFTVDGQRNIITNTGASASLRVYEPLTYGKVGRSDHQPFHDAGIPSAVFTYAPLEPEYHQPTDTIDKISKEKMDNVAKTVAAALYQLARKQTPALDNSNVGPKPVEPPFENRPL
ncbi:predicted aminopeptidases [Bacillus sp. OxB-1]|uniref:M28 family peptidase n=1 Tax=Bacillus sp. (strain OxB-1) TaxID=98228 RepID=UPI0005821070|nr:M28 family peptidase [Bacillus sp. OxB-1]BAQ09714.1 predicted aminopeptidases [Bacillus sp. OxB-1]